MTKMIRFRIIYKKFSDLIYTGNLDMQKIWERSFRRANLPIAYSSGFHPQARIQQAVPLPLGYSGSNEIIDVWIDLDEEIDHTFLKLNLQSYLPDGIRIKSVENIDLKSPSLQSQVIAAEYDIKDIHFKNINDLHTLIKNLINSQSVIRERRGKIYNLRELIEVLEIQEINANHKVDFFMRLKHLPGATGRPEEVLRALGIDDSSVQIERKKLIFASFK